MNSTHVRQWLIDRARERSTWLGLTALAGLCGVQIAPEQMDAIAQGAIAITAVIAAVTKDR